MVIDSLIRVPSVPLCSEKKAADFVLNFFGIPHHCPQSTGSLVFLQGGLFTVNFASTLRALPTVRPPTVNLSRIASKHCYTEFKITREEILAKSRFYLSEVDRAAINGPRLIGALPLACHGREIDKFLISGWKLWASRLLRSSAMLEQEVTMPIARDPARELSVSVLWTSLKNGDESLFVADASKFPNSLKNSSISSCLDRRS